MRKSLSILALLAMVLCPPLFGQLTVVPGSGGSGGGGATNLTPWTSNIDAASFVLNNLAGITTPGGTNAFQRTNSLLTLWGLYETNAFISSNAGRGTNNVFVTPTLSGSLITGATTIDGGTFTFPAIFSSPTAFANFSAGAGIYLDGGSTYQDVNRDINTIAVWDGTKYLVNSGTLTGLHISGTDIVIDAVNLADPVSSITGVLGIANGGTGSATVATNAFFVGANGGSTPAAPSFRQMNTNDMPPINLARVDQVRGGVTGVLPAANVAAIPLTSGVIGILPVANGGTAAATFATNAFFAAPDGGSTPAAPSPRQITTNDLPAINLGRDAQVRGGIVGKLPAGNIADTAVTPGAYTSANITVDQQGRITAAANGSGGGSQTPWTSLINGGGFGLGNASGVQLTNDTTAVGSAFTNGTAVYYPSSTLNAITIFGSGSTTATNGVVLSNLTAATSGNQKVSPQIKLSGNGFYTGGSTSGAVSFYESVTPVQGTTATGNWILESQIGAAAKVTALTVSSAGAVTVPGALVFDSGSVANGNLSGPAGNWQLTSAGAFSGLSATATTLTANGSVVAPRITLTPSDLTKQSILITSAGMGTSPTNGIYLTNSTAAAAGAQQVSPDFTMIGNGWKTTATAASQPVAVRQYVLPVQGTANPTMTWQMDYSVNGGSWNRMNYVNTVDGYLRNDTGFATGNLSISSSGPNVITTGSGSLQLNSANGIIDMATPRYFQYPISKTASYSVVSGDKATYFNNTGASGTITFTLPTAASGYHYFFTVDVAQILNVTAAGSDVIRWGSTVSGAAGTISSSTIGHSMHLFSPKAGVWVVDYATEAWTLVAARRGNATLVGGTVTVNNATVTANTIVMLTRKTSGGTIGTAITYTVSAGTSFTITSDNILDTSVFSWSLQEIP